MSEETVNNETSLTEVNQESGLVNKIKDNTAMMETIATDSQSLEDIRNLTSTRVTDQLKVFLIAQARNELMRVVKLTRFLDKLESNFMNKVDQAISDDDLTLKQYSEILATITSLLARSNDIVYKVLKDTSLMTILNTTIYTTDSSVQTSSVVASLKDPHSRERVRNVINNILLKTDQYVAEHPDSTIIQEEESE